METRVDLDAVINDGNCTRIHDQNGRSPQQLNRGDLEKSVRNMQVTIRPQHSLSKRKRSVWKCLFASTLMLSIFSAGNRAIAQILAPNQVLQSGDAGPQVTQLQEALSRRGYFDGPFTGIYGSLTENAVRRFQQDNPRVAIDGVYGAETEAALFGLTSAPPQAVFSSFSTPAPSFQAFATPGSRTLRLFDNGEDVLALQRLLRDRGYSPGTLDGVFGTATQSAVRAFQLANGLTVDGIVGPSTWRALGVTGGPNPNPNPNPNPIPVGRDVSIDVVLRQGRYVVVVPGDEGAKLTTIERELGRTAYRTRSGRGSFLTPGGYTTYRAARSDVLRLRAAGLDARVEYF